MQRLRTGEPQWSYRVQGHDPWVRACGAQPPTVTWCAPESDGEKWDLGGSGPNVFQLGPGKHTRVVGLGEKSGVYLLVDAKTGEFVWNTLVGPGGDQGGMEWGTAYDGDRIYVAITNQHHIPYRLTPSGESATGGSWAALDAATGEILWRFAAGSTVNSGPAVVDGTVFWGSGYARAAEGNGNNRFYAFSL